MQADLIAWNCFISMACFIPSISLVSNSRFPTQIEEYFMSPFSPFISMRARIFCWEECHRRGWKGRKDWTRNERERERDCENYNEWVRERELESLCSDASMIRITILMQNRPFKKAHPPLPHSLTRWEPRGWKRCSRVLRFLAQLPIAGRWGLERMCKKQSLDSQT